MPLINTCPHAIRLVQANDHVVHEVPRGTILLRLVGSPEEVGTAYGVPVITAIEWDAVENWDELVSSLPAGDENDLVVSMEVGKYFKAQGLPEGVNIRHVYGPSQDAGDIVRDLSGIPFGTRRLTRYV